MTTKKHYTPRLRICNNPQCLKEFVTLSHLRFYCEDCRKEKRRELSRKWKEANPGKSAEYKRRNREKMTDEQRDEERRRNRERYHNMNPEQRENKLRKSREYQQTHQEQHRESARRYKAAKRLLQRQSETLPETVITKPVEIRSERNRPAPPVRTIVDMGKPDGIRESDITAKLNRLEQNGEYIYCERMRARLRRDFCGARQECRMGRDGCPRCPKDKLKARRRPWEEDWI